MNLKSKLLLLALFICIFLSGCIPETYTFDKEIVKPGSGPNEFLSAIDMALTKEGNIVLCEYGNKRIHVLDKDGNNKLIIDGKSSSYKFKSLAGIGVNERNGNIAVCDYKANKVYVFNKKGRLIAKINKVKHPMDVDFDKVGNLYIITSKGAAVLKYGMNGVLRGKIGGKGGSALLRPSTIFYYKKHLYIGDITRRRIIKMNMKGKVILEIASKGDFEPFKGPSCIYVDNEENIYVSDIGEVPAVKFSPNGEFISRIGRIGDGKGEVIFVKGIGVLPDGRVVLLDNAVNKLIFFKMKPS